MPTKHQLISDIILELLQGNNSDDSELEEKQVAFWIQYHLHDLVRQEVTAEMKKGNMPPPVYIKRDEGLEMSEENVTDISDSKQRIWVDLVDEVLDLPNDRGIIRVEDYDGNLILKTSIDQLGMVRDLRFSKPSIDTPLYYRIGTKVFVEGFNTADIDYNPLIVYYIPKQDVIAMEDTDEVLITDQLIPVLIDLCVQRGKLELYGTQADTANDGVDNKNVQYHTAISNPTANDQQTQ